MLGLNHQSESLDSPPPNKEEYDEIRTELIQ